MENPNVTYDENYVDVKYYHKLLANIIARTVDPKITTEAKK